VPPHWLGYFEFNECRIAKGLIDSIATKHFQGAGEPHAEEPHFGAARRVFDVDE
jgi:hypothetical protein